MRLGLKGDWGRLTTTTKSYDTGRMRIGIHPCPRLYHHSAERSWSLVFVGMGTTTVSAGAHSCCRQVGSGLELGLGLGPPASTSGVMIVVIRADHICCRHDRMATPDKTACQVIGRNGAFEITSEVHIAALEFGEVAVISSFLFRIKARTCLWVGTSLQQYLCFSGIVVPGALVQRRVIPSATVHFVEVGSMGYQQSHDLRGSVPCRIVERICIGLV